MIGLYLLLLSLIFITLKLCGIILWSWWLVLLPIEIIVFAEILYQILLYYGDRKYKGKWWRHYLK